MSEVMTTESEWWFDGDYSECYYAWGHVDKAKFACWVEGQQDGDEVVKPEDVEHLWASIDEIDSDRFHILKRVGVWRRLTGISWWPPLVVRVTRYQP